MSRLVWDVNRCCINVMKHHVCFISPTLYNIISLPLDFGKSPKTPLNLIRISMEDYYACEFVFRGIRNKQVFTRSWS